MTKNFGELVTTVQNTMDTLFSGPMGILWKGIAAIALFYILRAVLNTVLDLKPIRKLIAQVSKPVQKAIDHMQLKEERRAHGMIYGVLRFLGFVLIINIISSFINLDIISETIGAITGFLLSLVDKAVWFFVIAGGIAFGLGGQARAKKFIEKEAPKEIEKIKSIFK